jgi:hypothetical protein
MPNGPWFHREEAGVNMPPDAEPELPDDDDAPLLPTQSREDTDAGWGEYRDRDDDDRLLRDRPPHWDNA